MDIKTLNSQQAVYCGEQIKVDQKNQQEKQFQMSFKGKKTIVQCQKNSPKLISTVITNNYTHSIEKTLQQIGRKTSLGITQIYIQQQNT